MCREHESPRYEHLTDSDIQCDYLKSYDYDVKQSGKFGDHDYTQLYSLHATLDNLVPSSPMDDTANKQESGYCDMRSPIEHSRMAISPISGAPSSQEVEWENNAFVSSYNYGAFSFNQDDVGFDDNFEEYQNTDPYRGI